MPGLPQEIIDIIILEIANSPRTLRSCAVVSSSFQDTAQRLLFQSIEILVTPHASPSNQNLCETLHMSPRLRTYVESLTVKVAGRDDFALPALPFDLPHLRHLTLQGIDPFTPIWRLLTDRLRSHLLAFLWLPTLETFTVHHVQDFPLNALRNCTHLKALSLTLLGSRIGTSSVSLPSPLLAVGLGELQSLTITPSRISPHVCLAISPVSLLCIQSYTTYISTDDDNTQCEAMLALLATTLTELVLTIHAPFKQPPNLRNLLKLKTLKLYLTGPKELRVILSAVQSVADSDNLEELVIRFRGFLCTPGAPHGNQWKKVDQLLTSERRTARFRRLVMHVIGISLDDRLRDAFREMLPNLYSMGYVYFKTPAGCVIPAKAS